MSPSASLLLRATELIGHPVVTLDGGEDIAEVKDVVYGTAEAELLGFTLNRRGFWGRRMKKVLAWDRVAALGAHAVMIATAGDLDDDDDALVQEVKGSRHRNVIGSEVITDSGQRLGEVTDVVILVADEPEVVGYEIGGSEILTPRAGGHVFIPLPETLAVSGEALMVPAAVNDFVSDDLAGFGASVEQFREHLRSTA
ncbi:MAG: PRC-barrel domain-containing protein [Actinobacteria bacterium]|nr:PRC-barrel domain-containing protein [Actinomycetota bacterium]MBW3642854.1 PRC-barrel domain-containing protein [Actinomycetota bacterium]